MFSKTAKPATPEAAAAPTLDAVRKAPKVASLIAEDLTIDGGLTGDVELHIDGCVRGDVRVARLSIGETGVIEGSVEAEAVDCRGRVIGAVTALQVRLYGTAHIEGDITHDQLTMELGAFFQGRSLKLPKAQPLPAPLELPSIAAAE